MQGTLQEELELEKSVRRLREKFYGQIPIETAVLLMRKFVNNHDQVCRSIILLNNQLHAMDPEDRRNLMKDQVAKKVINKLRNETDPPQDPAKDKDIQEIATRLKLLPLTEKNLAMFNNATVNRIPSESKQFACKDCDNMWWRRVPERKKVSRCHRCHKKFDPLPDDQMWGIAEFHCPNCHRMFKGFTQMGVPVPCYTCNTPVLPSCILPPRRNHGPRTNNAHSCYAEDCYNPREPHVPGLHCVHPRSRSRNHLPKVLCPSTPHISTGSTVATCLSQGSLNQCDIDDLIMDDIKETDEEEEESEGSDS